MISRQVERAELRFALKRQAASDRVIRRKAVRKAKGLQPLSTSDAKGYPTGYPAQGPRGEGRRK